MEKPLKETDAVILQECRDELTKVKKQLDWVNSTKEERVTIIRRAIAPFLERLANNGWPQLLRMSTIIKIWDEIE
jgi:hypothetical protein